MTAASHSQPVTFDDLLHLEQKALRCPHAAFSFAAEETQDDIIWSEPIKSWTLLKYDLILAVLRNAADFSSKACGYPPVECFPGFDTLKANSDPRVAEYVRIIEEGRVGAPLLMADAPDHTRLRPGLAGALMPQNIKHLEPGIRRLVDHLIDALPEEGETEFIESFCVVLPLQVISDFLEIPQDLRTRFRALSDSAVLGELSPSGAIAALSAEEEIRAFFSQHVESATAAADSYIDYLQKAVAAGTVSLYEAAGLCREVVIAGNESTRYFLGSIMAYLGSHIETQSQLRAEPALIVPFIEEMLRLHGPFNGFWRRATRDLELAGQQIAKGDAIFLPFTYANREASKFPEPDELDLKRSFRPQHIAFGAGRHACVGANLARLELRIALEHILARMKFELIGDRDTIEYYRNFIQHIPKHVEISYKMLK